MRTVITLALIVLAWMLVGQTIVEQVSIAMDIDASQVLDELFRSTPR